MHNREVQARDLARSGSVRRGLGDPAAKLLAEELDHVAVDGVANDEEPAAPQPAHTSVILNTEEVLRSLLLGLHLAECGAGALEVFGEGELHPVLRRGGGREEVWVWRSGLEGDVGV